MQEPCAERQRAGSPTLEPGAIKREPLWAPEDFLQSSLREGKAAALPAAPPKLRGRRKQQWKLKFHHQALPPEYLDHYEASLCRARMEPAPAAAPPAPPESVSGWLQRVAGLAPPAPPAAVPAGAPRRRRAAPPPSAPAKVLNYRDLPYMGEMTLNNSKPRRGRKPKKADICHLIYKNYGTIFPGTPGHLVDERLAPPAPQRPPELAPKPRTDLQNRIISSLLEKRLSQETRRHRARRGRQPGAPGPTAGVSELAPALGPPPAEPPPPSEPLNLCVRDLNNLKIRLLRKHGNVYTKAGEAGPAVELAEAGPTKLEDRSETESVLSGEDRSRDPASPPRLGAPEAPPEALPGGYVYWPHAGVFVHPLALQSQLLYYRGLAGGACTVAPESPPALPAPPSPGGAGSSASPAPSDGSGGSRLRRAALPATPAGGAAKRKRSAIFIPPVPSEAGASPATEVSICKFKFTGGARPSLQEKKMLSVDSGGNFRYYSGTGDKANRGYEFFPRETLQQSAGVGSSAAPAPPVPAEPARRKRRSRKSLQREKLEQTFKEKGFLIQTQQLESAEGATYCKFRQLRKFTRYLFRSWKDYLPGAVQPEEPAAPLRACDGRLAQ